MQPTTAELAEWRAHDARLTACLAGPGWVSDGRAQERGPGAGGPCYQWTRQVRGKTVSVALSREPYASLAAAIAHWRTGQITMKAMQRLSGTVLFTTVRGAPRRKRLGQRTLGLVEVPFGLGPAHFWAPERAEAVRRTALMAGRVPGRVSRIHRHRRLGRGLFLSASSTPSTAFSSCGSRPSRTSF